MLGRLLDQHVQGTCCSEVGLASVNISLLSIAQSYWYRYKGAPCAVLVSTRVRTRQLISHKVPLRTTFTTITVSSGSVWHWSHE